MERGNAVEQNGTIGKICGLFMPERKAGGVSGMGREGKFNAPGSVDVSGVLCMAPFVIHIKCEAGESVKTENS